ncbi:MAG TPA: RQC domain-containing protein, partial [Chondromyces sp.]|nr:RQC domain-containing protein [Chondromyces sp.]
GRAGRDGMDSECVLLYSPQDVQTQRFLIDQSSERIRIPQELEKLQQMIDYCHTESCLQEYILRYFGEEETEPCGRCGNCTDTREHVDVTKEAQMVLSCIIRMGQRYGKALTAQVLTGSKNKKVLEFGFHTLPTYGIMKNQSAKEVGTFIEFLISQDLIAVEQGTFPIIFITPKGKEVLLGKRVVERKEAVKTREVSNEDPLFEELRALRKVIAEREKVPPFVIFSDAALKDMCTKLPLSREEFLAVSGVGESKLDKYGNEFLEAIVTFKEAHPNYESVKYPETLPKKISKMPIKDSHLITLEMYKNHLSIQEIAQKRELSVATVENHLLLCAEQDLDIELLSLIPEDFLPLIEEAVGEVGNQRLKPIKELLPGEVSYLMIKAYLKHQSLSSPPHQQG